MSKLFALAAAGLLAISVATAALASENAMSGKQMSVTGQVIDLACFTAAGLHGASHKACALACAKAGGSLGILTKDGEVYVSIEPKPATNPNKFLLSHLEETVTATGTVFESHGLKSIAIASVK